MKGIAESSDRACAVLGFRIDTMHSALARLAAEALCVLSNVLPVG